MVIFNSYVNLPEGIPYYGGMVSEISLLVFQKMALDMASLQPIGPIFLPLLLVASLDL